jgi:hypothetical protein
MKRSRNVASAAKCLGVVTVCFVACFPTAAQSTSNSSLSIGVQNPAAPTGTQVKTSPTENISTKSVPQRARLGIVNDWSQRHLLFPPTNNSALLRRLKKDPRWAQSYYLNHREAWWPGLRHPSQTSSPNPGLEDWNVSLGSVTFGPIVESGNTDPDGGQVSPAKYTFDVSSAPSCTNDFVVMSMPVSPVAGGQANIVGFNDLYTGADPTTGLPNGYCTDRTGPQLLFAYASGEGEVPGSISISLDGTKLAYIEDVLTGSSYFHVLTIGSGTSGSEGSSPTSAVVPGTGASNAVDVRLAITPDGNPAHDLQGSTTSPFIDYASDSAYVTTYTWTSGGSGYVYKISPVFGSGSPAIVWSVLVNCPSVDGGPPSVPSSPIYDSVSYNVFFTDTGSRIDYVTDNGSTATLTCGNVGNYDNTAANPPTVDSVNEFVYATFNSNGANEYVTQIAAMNPPNDLGTGGGSIGLSVGGENTSFTGPYNVDFTSDYYNCDLSLGACTGSPLLYVAGMDSLGTVPTLYAEAFTSDLGMEGDFGTSPSSIALATGAADSSEVSEFYNPDAVDPSTGNPGEDFLFVGVTNNCPATDSGGTAGCVMSLDITSGPPTITAATPAIPAPGGSTGIIVDNAAEEAQAANIYYATRSTGYLVKTAQSGTTLAGLPTFSPAAGTYSTAQTVIISDVTPSPTIYYTTDGTTPTTSSSIYTTSITVSSTETLKAIAVASGYMQSAVATANFTIALPPAATPILSPTGGNYASTQTVTISDSTPGATIYYTVTPGTYDGIVPTSSSRVYSTPITISSSETVDAIAVASGDSQSAVATAVFIYPYTPWSAFLDQSRAIDWSTAGFTIPNYTVNCAMQPTLLLGPIHDADNGVAIRTALSSCDATHNAVLIPTGTYYVDYIMATNGKQVLRGAGPNSTTLIFTVGIGGGGGLNSGLVMTDDGLYNGSPQVLPPSGLNQCLWTDGFSQGSTSITLSSCGGTPPINQTIILDQANDTSDTSGVYICDVNIVNCGYESSTGGNNDGRFIPDGSSGITHSQQQVDYITGVTSLGGGSYTVTLATPVYFTNIRSGKSAGVWWPGMVQNIGLEDLTVDGSNSVFSDGSTISMYDCYQCWVKNVRSVDAGRNHVMLYQSANDVIRDSYFYQSQSHYSESYVVEAEESSAFLVENNIFQQVTNPLMFGQGSGAVVGYNFSINNPYTGADSWMAPAYSVHNAGNEMNLWEGNNFNGVVADNAWGSSDQITYFRNLLNGWQACSWDTTGGVTCDATGETNFTQPVVMRANVRTLNLVGNVLGQPGYHNQYQTYATSTSGGTGADSFTSIFSLGWAGIDTCSTESATACDPLTFSTAMRWGNYDTVNAATRYNTTEGCPAAVAYVNANCTNFTTPSMTLPGSLYYSGTPSWWPSAKAFPPIGPDVTTGNLGLCPSGTYQNSEATSTSQCGTGSLTTAWTSHVTSIPAQDCYLNTMGGPPDGSGPVLNFDANSCYWEQ